MCDTDKPTTVSPLTDAERAIAKALADALCREIKAENHSREKAAA